MVHIHGIDRQTNTQQFTYAIIYVPKRSRDRFQSNCVQICVDKNDALNKTDVAKKWFGAEVYGPSKSSEGVLMYYLNQWLVDPKTHS